MLISSDGRVLRRDNDSGGYRVPIIQGARLVLEASRVSPSPSQAREIYIAYDQLGKCIELLAARQQHRLDWQLDITEYNEAITDLARKLDVWNKELMYMNSAKVTWDTDIKSEAQRIEFLEKMIDLQLEFRRFIAERYGLGDLLDFEEFTNGL